LYFTDTAALDELERKLIIAERDFIESDIERRIEEMRTARVTQVRMISQTFLNLNNTINLLFYI
jgi:hypothetical protein